MTENLIILKAFIECTIKATDICGELFWSPHSLRLPMGSPENPDPIKPYFIANISMSATGTFGDNRNHWSVYLSYTFEVPKYSLTSVIVWRERVVIPEHQDFSDDLVKWLCDSVEILKNERSLADPSFWNKPGDAIQI
jgi:hypothetical protein